MARSIDPRLKLTLSMLRVLVHKLAVISGQCDLLSDHLKEGSQCAKRVIAIRGITREMAKDLDEYPNTITKYWNREAQESKNSMSPRPNELSGGKDRFAKTQHRNSLSSLD